MSDVLDDLKIAKATPIYEADNSSNITNYWLPCFS